MKKELRIKVDKVQRSLSKEITPRMPEKIRLNVNIKAP